MEKVRYFWIDIEANGNQTDDTSSEDSSEEETSIQDLKSYIFALTLSFSL